MLKNSKAFGSFSVNDLSKAKKFYEEVLGLVAEEESYGTLRVNISDNNFVMLYPKDDHIPATYTVLNFPVDDIEKAVDELTAKGVVFEQYEGDLKTDEKGISRNGPGPLMAWFKDPAGNFLSLLQDK